MRKPIYRLIPLLALLAMAAFACSINVTPATQSPADQANQAGTIAAYTLDAIASNTAVAATLTAAAAPPPTPTTKILVTLPAAPDPAAPTVGTQSPPTMSKSTLCWLGPGNAYEVSSSVQTGTKVDLIGRGSIDGWWIIKGPIYHDPCWIMADTLQIDPSFDTSSLQVYYPPPTPTPTATATPTP